MPSDLYLILHKVRGAPALDIARKCDDMGSPSDSGPWWIIPTSGWRAYPGAAWPVEALSEHMLALLAKPELLEDWENVPDHFAHEQVPAGIAPLSHRLLERLGLRRSKPIKRRKL